MLTKRYNLSLIAIIEDIMRVDSRQVVNQQKLRNFFSQTYQRHCWQERKPKQRKRTRQLREEFGTLLYYYYWCDGNGFTFWCKNELFGELYIVRTMYLLPTGTVRVRNSCSKVRHEDFFSASSYSLVSHARLVFLFSLRNSYDYDAGLDDTGVEEV